MSPAGPSRQPPARGGATWVVTPEGGEPYRVVLRPEGEGWSATVERGAESWSFALAAGPAEGRTWVGETLVRWRWDAREGRLVLGPDEHALAVESEAAHRLARLAPAGRAAARVEEVRAPMPGLVVAVEVDEGARVEAGGGLVIIEAMKMENEILAPAAGVVRDLAVEPGRTVELGTLLCRIAPPEAPA